jgi:hypothetical protein
MNSRCAALIRPRDEIIANKKVLEESIINEKLEMPDNISNLFALNEIMLMSRMMYDAIDAYIKGGGKSRGSYLIIDSIEGIKNYVHGEEIDTQFRDKVIITNYAPGNQHIVSAFRKVRPIPESNTWFEQIWHEYRSYERIT